MQTVSWQRFTRQIFDFIIKLMPPGIDPTIELFTVLTEYQHQPGH
jgi:hypothetical protein